METKDAMLQRRSFRQFLTKLVPDATISEIIADALWATSNPEAPIPQEWSEAHKARYQGIGKSVRGSLDIKRAGADGRTQWANSMYAFFDAPAMVMMTKDNQLVADNKRIIIGTALGRPDLSNDINLFNRQRGELNAFVSFKS